MPQRNRGWVWFFVVLAVLAVLAIAINWLYNARRQLTVEELTAAQDRWDRHGPPDYDLEIAKEVSAAAGGEAARDRITVEVRGGKARAGTINGRPLEARLLGEYDMTGWLGFVETFLKRDTQPGAPRTYRVADFDRQTGALQRFVRRVSGGRERQEVVIRLTPANPAAGP